VGDSGEQDLELYTEIALSYHPRVLGIFIRDVTTPLLTQKPSSSTSSLPSFFDGNGTPKQGRLATLKSFRDSFRTKSQERVPTLSVMTTDGERTLADLSLGEVDLLSPIEPPQQCPEIHLPNRTATTPPPTRPSPARTQSITSLASEPDLRPATTTAEEQTVRVKRVEAWKRRIARSRERLSPVGVEVWTWRVGSDVEGICEEVILRGVQEESLRGLHGIGEKLRESRIGHV
jgi:hypothetical protein